ncbi:Ig-like domain-containing protein [Streptomyces sp. NPDC088732]|uniref:Ig-like domain-containing protein n=1 Tax=Streptomyces sp. NPDC088732 TaxID=3365879 RepID=UPI003819FD47
MTVLHPFRRAASIAAACALLALGLVTLVASQSQPARAASIGTFTMAPSGKLSDPEPLGSTIGIPAACPDFVIDDGNGGVITFPFNWGLFLNVVKDGTEVRAIDGIYNDADRPYDSAKTISLAAADNPDLAVHDLSQIFSGDGTYELRLQCMDDFSGTHPDSPYWTQQITVTGDDWVVGEGATAVTVALPEYSPSQPEPGQEVTLTATVTPAEAVGTVTFLDGGTPLNQTPVQVAAGKAEFKTSTLSDGGHSIIARFTPDNPAEFGASESEARTVTVQLPRAEMLDNAGQRIAPGSELQRGQTVKLILRGCAAGDSYGLTMNLGAGPTDATFPDRTADAGGVVTWEALTVPEDAVASPNYNWVWTPNCDPTFPTMAFKVPEPPSGSPSPTDSTTPTDDPTDDPTDSPSPTDSATDTSGTTSGTSGGDTAGDSGGSGDTGGTGSSGGSGSGGSGGNSPQGGLASTGSQIALFSGVGAVVLAAAGFAFVRLGGRRKLLTFGPPRS